MPAAVGTLRPTQWWSAATRVHSECAREHKFARQTRVRSALQVQKFHYTEEGIELRLNEDRWGGGVTGWLARGMLMPVKCRMWHFVRLSWSCAQKTLSRACLLAFTLSGQLAVGSHLHRLPVSACSCRGPPLC